MSKYAINDTTLIAIGDAIREKEGTAEPIPVAAFAERIAAITTGESYPSGEEVEY